MTIFSPPLGLGMGLRRPHYDHVLEHRPPVGWFEVISENFMATDAGSGGPAIHTLEQVRSQYPVVLHGVSLSIGSADPLNRTYLKRLKALADRIEPAMVSDHLCWTGVDGENLHDLLPLPYTEMAIRHVVERVQEVQEFLGRRILLENVSSYLSYTHSEALVFLPGVPPSGKNVGDVSVSGYGGSSVLPAVVLRGLTPSAMQIML